MDCSSDRYSKSISSLDSEKAEIINGYDWNQATILKSELDDLIGQNDSCDEFRNKLKCLYWKGVLRRLLLNSMPGEPQRINSDMCTTSALAVLIRRHQILHDESPTFSFADIRRNMTGENSLINPTKYHTDKMVLDIDALRMDGVSAEEINQLQQQEQWIPHPVGPSYDMTWISSDGRHYRTKQLKDATVKTENDLMKLLDQNPAGLYVYAKYSDVKKHAIVISDYEIDENYQVTFYCFDSVEKGEFKNMDLLGMRSKLINSRLFTGNLNQLSFMFASFDKIVVMDVSEQVVRNADSAIKRDL